MIGLFRSLSTSAPPREPPTRERARDEGREHAVLATFLANLERLCSERRRRASGEGAR